MYPPTETPHGFKTLERLFAQPNLPAEEYHVHLQLPETPQETEATLEFNVLVEDDMGLATDDPLATGLLDTFIAEARPMLITVYYVTNDDPEMITVSTWVVVGDHFEGWSRATQAEIASHAAMNPFEEGLLVNGSAWPAKYGGLVV